MIVLKRAAEGDKTLMWSDSEKYPALAEADMGIQAVEMDLADELKSSKSTDIRILISYIVLTACDS